MLDRSEIVRLLRETGFDPGSYWVVAGAAMVLHGIKTYTRDLDLGCSQELADRLQQRGFPVDRAEDGSRRIRYNDKIELFEDWKEGEIEMVDTVPVLSVDGIVRMKQQLGREKDFKDIALIEHYLTDHR